MPRDFNIDAVQIEPVEQTASVPPEQPSCADFVTVLTVNGRGNKLVSRDESGEVEKQPGTPIIEATAQTARVKNSKAMCNRIGTSPSTVSQCGVTLICAIYTLHRTSMRPLNLKRLHILANF